MVEPKALVIAQDAFAKSQISTLSHCALFICVLRNCFQNSTLTKPLLPVTVTANDN